MNAREGIKTDKLKLQLEKQNELLKTMNAREGIKTLIFSQLNDITIIFVKNNECP